MEFKLWNELNDEQAENISGGVGEIVNEPALPQLFEIFPDGEIKPLPNGNFVAVPDGSSVVSSPV